MKTLLDLTGLTLTGNPVVYAQEIGVLGDVDDVIEPAARLDYLARLRSGRGYTVLCGPWAREYWCLAGPEVNVTVVPDGYGVDDRAASVAEWAYRVQGVPVLAYRQWLAGKEPTRRHGQYESYLAAQQLMADFASNTAGASVLVHDEYKTQVVSALEMVQRLEGQRVPASVDFEWDTDDNDKTFGLAFSDETDNLYVAFGDGERAVIEQAFTNYLDRGLGILHNAPADIATAYQRPSNALTGVVIDDTMVMAYLAGEPRVGLKEVTRQVLRREPIEYSPNLKALPVSQQARYAAGDTRNTFDLAVALRERLQSTGQFELYSNVERALVPVLSHMSRVGQPLDLPEMERLHANISATERGLESHLRVYGGFDPTESESALAGLHKHVGYNIGSLDKRVLSRFRHPVIDTYIGYSNMRTLRRNYLDKYLERGTDRIHPRFNQAGTVDRDGGIQNAPRTGRLSSANPNVQQLHELLRRMFIPESGCLLWALDYSGMEIVIAGALSGDQFMLQYREKLHDMFQQQILSLTGMDLPRKAAKTGNFEKLFRGGDGTLMQILRTKERIFITRKEARAIGKAHHETYATYWDWGDTYIAQCVARGYSETLRGRRRYIPELESPDPSLQNAAERAALNHAVQGLGADIMKEVMVECQDILTTYNATMSMQVHDEIVGSVPKGMEEPFLRDMTALMESKHVYGTHLTVAGATGETWADAH